MTIPDDVAFLDYGNLNFGIGGSSPAIDLGEPIPGFTDDVLDGLPDVGAFEYGEAPGNDWPRPRQTAFTCDPPERWNGVVPEDYCADDDDDDDSGTDDDDDTTTSDDDDNTTDGGGDDDTTDGVGVADDDDDSGDCACSAAGGQPAGSHLIIATMGIWAARRRRRR